MQRKVGFTGGLRACGSRIEKWCDLGFWAEIQALIGGSLGKRVYYAGRVYKGCF